MRGIELNEGQKRAMKLLRMWYNILSDNGDVFRIFGYARNW